MSSNKIFKKEIAELAKALGLEVHTEGLNNNKLAALVKDLRAKKKDAETETQADNAPRVADKAAVEPESKNSYLVCTGKAITTRRGILSNGDEIKAEDISGGKEALGRFILSGHVKKG